MQAPFFELTPQKTGTESRFGPATPGSQSCKLQRKRAIVVPAGVRAGLSLEVYDSKEFTGNAVRPTEKTAQSIYKISQKFQNPLHSLGVFVRKRQWCTSRSGGR